MKRQHTQFGPTMGDNPPPITDGHTVFTSSCLGYVGAYDALTGKHLWAFEFPFKSITSTLRYRHFNKGWIINRPVLWKNILIVAPGNSTHLYALDKMTGKQVWSFPHSGTHHFVLGIHDGKIVIAGNKITVLDAATGKEVWSKVPVKEAKSFGRGCLYNGIIYHPTEKGLFLVDVENGNVLHSYKWDDFWKQGGNVMITGGKLVVCGYNKITVYDSVEAKKKYSKTNKIDKIIGGSVGSKS